MSRYKLTPEQRARALQMYIDGEKLEYIGALFSITRHAVAKIARRGGAPHRFPKMRDARRARVQSANRV